MTCNNTIVEFNSNRACWFPINRESPFSLCTRCDYYKIEEVLKDPSSLVRYKDNPKFLYQCSQKNHQESLLSALLSLKQSNSAFFERFYRSVLTTNLEHVLNHKIYTHTPSKCCDLYKHVLKTRIILRDIGHADLPWKCWNCLSFLLRQNEMKRYYPTFARGILHNRLPSMETNRSEAIDVMVSLRLISKDHACRILFERYRQEVKNDEKAREFLIAFLSEPSCIQQVFQNKISELLPHSWNTEVFQKQIQKSVLQNVRKRNWCFKEELMVKTWAPERLFAWCFDIEELRDFPSLCSDY